MDAATSFGSFGAGDLIGGTPAGWIVCGWFTPDYRAWAEQLITSLAAHGAPYHIVSLPELTGPWEAKTMRKPGQILAALDRYPDQVVIFLDVDCTARGDLSPLAGISGDVGFFVRSKYRRAGGVRFGPRSGTVVLRPTPAARRYVEAWERAATEAPWGDVDQSAQLVAMARSPDTSFTALGNEWCAIAADKITNPVILHDSASASIAKLSSTRRRLHAIAKRYGL